jgi:hypothetical protein
MRWLAPIYDDGEQLWIQQVVRAWQFAPVSKVRLVPRMAALLFVEVVDRNPRMVQQARRLGCVRGVFGIEGL